ncbi:hypothetical protein [Ollibium composti]|uniref:hypothetical protein n=1 Tax=Ollibium composti TaxID=2675109 RepID=UPI001454BED6|nr:hypothetical protein [Mesorhizobium composti]
MRDEGPGIGLIILVAAGAWAIFGHPMRDVRSWTGNATYQDQLDTLTDLVKKKKLGETPDYWLTKTNFFGAADRVALVFGLMGDLEFCQDLADLYERKYPQSNYYCLPANNE